jgi:hypothetical protein
MSAVGLSFDPNSHEVCHSDPEPGEGEESAFFVSARQQIPRRTFLGGSSE